MWRRTSILLLLVRLFFALSPSYLHPDENFQGPEVIAGQIFDYPIKLTWEFDPARPVRSVFPLWPVYGLPMLLLKWIWPESGQDGVVAPIVVFRTLRVLMFLLSFVLEDWAIQELVSTPRYRRVAVLLVSSSYVTWTYQTHTFSNSVETLVVAWSLVVIQRIVEDKQRSSLLASAVLGVLGIFGVFNRITFPAFLLIPGLKLLPHFINKPLSFLSFLFCIVFTLFIAISVDTEFYTAGSVTWSHLLTNPIITPLNNLRYNLKPSNLAQHGLHPWYQHVLLNIPELLGPAAILLFFRPHLSLRLYSAISGVVVLSLFQHQEARFLLPTIPLILSSIQLPSNKVFLRLFVTIWIIFNATFGILMGVYHQGGVVPTQIFMSEVSDATDALWWKTYSPPIWLLDGKNEVLRTHDLMGMRAPDMIEKLASLATCTTAPTMGTYFIAPASALYLDAYTTNETSLKFDEVWRYRRHLNLDDLDFADDGIAPTIGRLFGRRGLVAWRVSREC